MIEFNVKAPKFSWKNIPKFKERWYDYPTVQIAEIGEDMYIKYSGQGTMYAVVKGWRSIPLTSLIMHIVKHYADISRHLEKALHQFYKENKVPFGYVIPIIKARGGRAKARHGYWKRNIVKHVCEIGEF